MVNAWRYWLKRILRHIPIAMLVLIVTCAAILGSTAACGEKTCGEFSIVKGADMTPEIYDADVERARAIRHKYEDIFWRQPNVHGTGIGIIEDENGNATDRAGFRITVTEKVDQSTLPPEDRIPDCLEGVPVQIRGAPAGRLPF